MKYLLTIYIDESGAAQASPEDAAKMTAQYAAFAESAQEAGVLLGGEGLQPTSTATTVRVRDGETLFTDGPFVETREALGGYFLLDCPDLDEATRWAARIPGAHTGAVEVRPVMDYEATGREAAHVRTEGSTV